MEIVTDAEFDAFIHGQPLALVYFSSPGCGVCEALKPKVAALVKECFPRLALAQVDCGKLPRVAASQGIFSVPAVVLYIEGREALRKVRSFGLGDLHEQIARPYTLFYEAGKPGEAAP